jgi:MoxR-like ATPase
MAKRSGSETQDYFSRAGGEMGRRTYAEQRKKLKKSLSARMSMPPNPPDAAERKGAVAAKGAAAETARRGKKRQAAKAGKKSEEDGRREVVERLVESKAHSASPTRMLPAAQRSTEVADFWRSLREDVRTLDKAAREIAGSVSDLARVPSRLWRLLRTFASAS